MPVFRDVRGRLYRIPADQLEAYAIESDGSERFVGAEVPSACEEQSQAEVGGYIWQSGEQAPVEAGGYIWQSGEQAPVEASGYVWQSGEPAPVEASGYVWQSGEQTEAAGPALYAA